MKEFEKFDKKIDNYAWNSRLPYKSSGLNKVFLGKDFLHDLPVIIKALPINQFTDEYIINNLLSDWNKINSIKSPFLCQPYDLLLTKHNLYLFEEYHIQGNIKNFLKEKKKGGNEKIYKFLNEFTKGLECLASNELVHGDLKLENLIISNGFLQINDFAFKKNLIRKNPNHVYQTLEQLSKKQSNLSPKTDIWALGCIFYELMTGKIPFFGLTELEQIEDLKKKKLILPEDLQDDAPVKEFLEGCLQISEEKRWDISKIISSKLITNIRASEGGMSKATINDLDYNAKLIVINLEQTIRKNNIDFEALFNKFDFSGDQKIDLSEFQTLLRLIDSKLSKQQIEHVFKLIDNDGSGNISLEELKELMGLEKKTMETGFIEDKDLELKIKKMMYVLRETINRNGLNINAIFSRYDNSGDMSLDDKEFFNLLKDISPSIEEEMANYLFRKLDYDGSGDIGLNEFKSYVLEDKDMEKKLKELEEKTQATVLFLKNMLYGQKLDMRKLFAKADKKDRGKINEEEFKDFLEVVNSDIMLNVVKHFFKKIDKDGSGYIEYEEFSNYLK